MEYILHNGDNYLIQTNGHYNIVNTLDKATRWKTVKKAENVLVHLSKNLQKYDLRVEAVCQKNETLEVSLEETEGPLGEMLNKVEDLKGLAAQLEERSLYLKNQIRETDRGISDIEHAAEFYKLNAAQGYKLYKSLHDERIKRRQYKDELQRIEYLKRTKLQVSSIENMERSISGLNNRKYTPRVKTELFANQKGAS